MKLKYSVINERVSRTSHCEIDLIGYYFTEDVIRDFQRVIEFHEMRYEKQKREYIEKYGQEKWDDYHS